jgi:hypothetical protein
LFEFPAGMVLPQRDHQSDNETRTQQLAALESWLMVAHPCDWPACRVEISLVLRKKKTTAGKMPLKNVLLEESFS